jgi:hypothetical protein
VGGVAPVKVEYDFIYETVETNTQRRRPKKSAVSSSSSIPSATPPSSRSARSSISIESGEWMDIEALTLIETLASSIYSNAPERINPLLLCQPVMPSLAETTVLDYKVIDIVDLTGPNEEHRHLSV